MPALLQLFHTAKNLLPNWSAHWQSSPYGGKAKYSKIATVEIISDYRRTESLKRLILLWFIFAIVNFWSCEVKTRLLHLSHLSELQNYKQADVWVSLEGQVSSFVIFFGIIWESKSTKGYSPDGRNFETKFLKLLALVRNVLSQFLSRFYIKHANERHSFLPTERRKT